MLGALYKLGLKRIVNQAPTTRECRLELALTWNTQVGSAHGSFGENSSHRKSTHHIMQTFADKANGQEAKAEGNDTEACMVLTTRKKVPHVFKLCLRDLRTGWERTVGVERHGCG